MAYRSLLCSNEIRRLRLTLKEVGDITAMPLGFDAPYRIPSTFGIQENPVLHIKKSIQIFTYKEINPN